jgi:8-oxo-dGTP pyrophosphatase MutT (NUDIX family)
MPVIAERSAGVLLYRIDPSDQQPHFLLLDYGRYWDYPKGHVEKGEDDRAAAIRELHEETGIADAQLDENFRHEMTYFFRDKRRGLVRKTVVFYLGQTEAREAKISHEHVGAEFLPYESALKRLKYANAKAALRAAHAHLGLVPSPLEGEG